MVRDQVSASHDDAVDLALLVDSTEVLTALLGRIASLKPEVPQISTEQIADGNPVIDEDLARTVLTFLETRGYTTTETSDSNSVNIHTDQCVDLFVSARDASRTLDRAFETNETSEAEFVCTLPAEDPSFGDVDPVDFGMDQITSQLLELCREADSEILITSPFLERGGVDWLFPGLEGALERGVSVSIISRELRPGEPNFEAVKKLVRESQSAPGEIELYDYYETHPEQSTPLYTLHSKVLIVDTEKAYVGSANFTKYGFSANLEIGVIVSGPTVKNLKHILSRVVADSDRSISFR